MTATPNMRCSECGFAASLTFTFGKEMNHILRLFAILAAYAMSSFPVHSVEPSINGVWSSNRELSIAVSKPVIDSLPAEKSAEVRDQYGITRLSFGDSTLTMLQTGTQPTTTKARYKVIDYRPDQITIELLDRPPSFHDGIITMHFIGKTRFVVIVA